ncbi:MAG: uridine kinase family protein [Anaerolineae bacterium]|jgi:uridine kinase
MITLPILIGIAGGSASGKTTLCHALEEALAGLDVRVVHMDRYFWPVKPRVRAAFTGTEWDDYNQPASFDLASLHRDIEAFCTSDAPPDVVIVEGLMTLHDDVLREKLDLRIFVDAPPDERIVRRLRRNMATGGDFDEIAAYYLDSVRWRHQQYVEPSRWHADLVYNGQYPSSRALDVLVAWIRAEASARQAAHS